MGSPFERLRPAHHEGEQSARLFVRRWAMFAVVLALAGMSVSWFAARRVAQGSAQHSREVFRMAAAQVGANLNLEVQHETDLLVGAAAFMQGHPHQQPDSFQLWTLEVHAVRRYPELIALAELLPTANLHGCPRAIFAGPDWISRYSSLASRAICTGTSNIGLSGGAGTVGNFGLDLLGMRFMGQDVPVYRPAPVRATAPGRPHDFIGMVALAIYPQVLLRRALAGYPGLSLRLTTSVGQALTFSAGPHVRGLSVSRRLRRGLTATTTGVVQSAAILGNGVAVLILLGGAALSTLLALALFLLGTGRARAMRLVGEKTTELAFQALHDGLTGLPNRMLVMDRIGHALARTSRGNPPVAVLFIDVDGFKTVNDTFGHAAGDELLRTVGARLDGVIRDADTVGRLGGDEFVVLLEPGDNCPSPELVAERILELLSQPIELCGGVEVRLSVSIGIAVGQRESTEQLLRDADLALYSAKHRGKNRYVVFEQTMQTAIADRHALEIDLGRAVARHELFLFYQPTFRLDDRRVGGVEALVRWQHPTRGLIAPDDFIPIAEESGLILEIGRWVAATACAQAAAWRRRGLALTMAINISGRQLDEQDFADEIREILEDTGLEPEALTLEITETALMRDPGEAALRLHELKALGVRIAIDDFGTGYSSLAYLREFPVDALKIDRTFISGLGSSPDADAFVTTLVQLGRTLDIRTLGEGIEDETQLRRLRDAHCEFGQGFLLARPLPAEQLEAMLVERRLTPAPAGAADSDPIESA